MALWLCRAGKYGEFESQFLNEGRIYLCWDYLTKDLSSVDDVQDLREHLQELYPDYSTKKIIQHSSQIWPFAKIMEVGDWIALPSKQKSTVHIGEITGEYTLYAKGENPCYHYREVKWLETDVPRTNFDQDILNSMGAFTTICRIQRNDAEVRVRAMQSNNWKATRIKPAPIKVNATDPADPVEDLDSDTDFDIEQTARDQITRMIFAKYNGHGMEALIKDILEAQGFTTFRSPKGPDGGIDLLAAPDTFGFGSPRICVQIKSQDSPVERPILDQLAGTMQKVNADHGILVCWGGVTSAMAKELASSFFKIRIWDQKDIIDQILEHYDNMDEDFKAEIPLKRVWTVVMPDSDGE